MFKKLAIAAVAAIFSSTPAAARIESNTGDLLNLMATTGLSITYNDSQYCTEGGYYGAYEYAGMKRSIHLCPGDTVDAIDHATVRHEAVHAIQHCVNVARGTTFDNPILEPQQVVEEVNRHLPSWKVSAIKQAYDQSEWLIEFEAFVGQEIFTATELMAMYKEACLAG